MRWLIDLNVVLDVLLQRQSFSPQSSRVLAAVEQRRADGFICATSVDTLHYLLVRAAGPSKAHHLLETILTLLSVVPVDQRVISSAYALYWPDFEDAIIHEAARLSGMDAIVTRDKDFNASAVAVLSPAEAVAAIR